jgi:uncharacterized protein
VGEPAASRWAPFAVVSFLFEFLVLGIGLIVGALSGLLGIGGGLLIVPLLVYLPPWLGFDPIDIRTASAVAVVQVTAASLSGTLAHRKRGSVFMGLAVPMSIASAAGALAGGVISAYLSPRLLLVALAILATIAALLMFLPPRVDAFDDAEQAPFSLPVVCAVSAVIGTIIGTIGAGAFLMMPTLIYLVGLPTRIALGTVLAVSFPTSLAASLGKLATGQVPYALATIAVLGAIVGAQVGSWLSARTPPRVLRWLYGALVSAIAAGLWWDILNGRG